MINNKMLRYKLIYYKIGDWKLISQRKLFFHDDISINYFEIKRKINMDDIDDIFTDDR